MKKIAVPVEGENLHGHFGGAGQFVFYTVENNTVTGKEKKNPPPHAPGAIPKWIISNGITDIILCGVGQRAVKLMESKNIKVVKGAVIKNADTLVEEYLSGKLETSDEACSGHDHHGHHGHHDHHH